MFVRSLVEFVTHLENVLSGFPGFARVAASLHTGLKSYRMLVREIMSYNVNKYFFLLFKKKKKKLPMETPTGARHHVTAASEEGRLRNEGHLVGNLALGRFEGCKHLHALPLVSKVLGRTISGPHLEATAFVYSASSRLRKGAGDAPNPEHWAR